MTAWIESSSWMQTTLYEHRLRWKPGGCKCKNHKNPLNESEKLCALTKIAFTMFAADLFVQSRIKDIHRSGCMLCLVHVAPDLVQVPVPRSENQIPFVWTLSGAMTRISNASFDVLLQLGVPSGHIGAILEVMFDMFIFCDYDEPKLRDCYTFFLEMVIRGHEDEVCHYRDDEGCSLLHIVCKSAHLTLDRGILFYYITQLLCMGLDPRETNDDNKTVIDVFIDGFCCNEIMDDFLSPICLSSNQYVIQSFVECVNALLPWFEDTSISQVHLPCLCKARYETVEELYIDLITVYQPFVDKHLFPDDAERYFVGLVSEAGLLRCIKSFPCLFCQPLIKLLYQELGRGFDLNKAIKMSHRIFSALPQESIASIIIGYWHYPDDFCTCHISTLSDPAKRPVSCKCCAWALLEMMVHCTANLNGLMNDSEDGNLLMELILYDPEDFTGVGFLTVFRDGTANMSNVSTVTKFIWMYDPASKDVIMDYLDKLYDDSDEADRKDVSDLQNMVQSVRPLTLLCRLCILSHIQWKDIRQLSLPPPLRYYLEIGDISRSHVVHDIL